MRIKSALVNLLYRLSPGLRKVAEDRDALTAELDVVRAERDALDQRNRAEAAEKGILIPSFAESVVNAVMLARRSDADGAISAAALRTEHRAILTSRAAKFVIFSNPRSGSTWLETLLGLLPDVHVDYELKWDVPYTPSDIHVILSKSTRTISQLLEEMDTDARVTGSKFVFDLNGAAPPDFRQMPEKIGSDVRVIHLVRNYRDVFLSIRRGYHHAPVRTDKFSGRLRNALDSADIRHAQHNDAAHVTPLTCVSELSDLLDNDIHIQSLRAAGLPYLQVSYDEVGDRLAEIAGFAGSQATPQQIADALARPAVAKLPAFEPASVVLNLDELDPLFRSFETLRQHLAGKPRS